MQHVQKINGTDELLIVFLLLFHKSLCRRFFFRLNSIIRLCFIFSFTHVVLHVLRRETKVNSKICTDYLILFCAPNSLPMCKRDNSNQFTCLPFTDSISLWTEKLKANNTWSVITKINKREKRSWNWTSLVSHEFIVEFRGEMEFYFCSVWGKEPNSVIISSYFLF